MCVSFSKIGRATRLRHLFWINNTIEKTDKIQNEAQRTMNVHDGTKLSPRKDNEIEHFGHRSVPVFQTIAFIHLETNLINSPFLRSFLILKTMNETITDPFFHPFIIMDREFTNRMKIATGLCVVLI